MSGESKSSTDLRNLIEELPESYSKQRLLKLIPRLESRNSILEVLLKENILKMMMTDAPEGTLKQRIQKSLLEIEDLKKHPVPRLQRFIESMRSSVNGKFYTVNDDLAVFLGVEHAYWVFEALREDLETRTRTDTYKQHTSNMLISIRTDLKNLEDALNDKDIDGVKDNLGVMQTHFVSFEGRYERLRRLRSTPKRLKLYENIRNVFSKLISMTNKMILEWKKMKQEDLNRVIVQAYNIISEKIPEELIKETHPVRLRL